MELVESVITETKGFLLLEEVNLWMQYAEKYKDNGGVDYIDSILGAFTGRSMAPLATADFVGLDVHKAIVDNVYNNCEDYAHETFQLPSFIKELINAGKLGRKTGEGLYKLEKTNNGAKRLSVYDIHSGTYRDKIQYVFPFAEDMKKNIKVGNYDLAFMALLNDHSQEAEICLHFLLNYILKLLELMYFHLIQKSIHCLFLIHNYHLQRTH